MVQRHFRARLAFPGHPITGARDESGVFRPSPGTTQHAVWVSHSIKGVFIRILAAKTDGSALLPACPKSLGPTRRKSPVLLSFLRGLKQGSPRIPHGPSSGALASWARSSNGIPKRKPLPNGLRTTRTLARLNRLSQRERTRALPCRMAQSSAYRSSRVAASWH